MCFIFRSPQWVLIYTFKNFGYEIIARPSVRPHRRDVGRTYINDTMSLNILAAIASGTSLLASSTSMPGLYLDSCQTLKIGEEGELQAIFKRLHCFIRTSRNERKLRILLHCPKDFCSGL